MEKLIFCNLDLIKTASQRNTNLSEQRRQIICFLEEMRLLVKEKDNQVVFYSHETDMVVKVKQEVIEPDDEFIFCSRAVIGRYVASNHDKSTFFVFVGGKDVDFQFAVNNKSLFIVPEWICFEEKASKYGIHVENIKQLSSLIRVLNNQNTWFFSLDIDENSKAYSLVDARYKYWSESEEEEDLVSGFQALIKEKKPYAEKYRKILLYHFLAGMTNSSEFDDIELFGVIPSSNCEVNEYIYDFMTHVRVLKGKRLPKNYGEEVPVRDKNLLIRHKPKMQNHGGGRTSQERTIIGAKEEFESLHLNPDYKKRMEKLAAEDRLNICIFDDYITHGNSFNAIRNILKKVGANRVVFVSIGSFVKDFQKWDYEILGDVFSPNYAYALVSQVALSNYRIDVTAKKEIKALYDIFNPDE